MSHSARARRPATACAVAIAAALGLVAPTLAAGPPGAGAQNSDPALDQTIDRDQAIHDGPAELSSGHVDVGPRFVDGAWRVLLHDTAVQPPVWRRPEDVVLRVTDLALLAAPDDPSYSFLGADPGRDVWIIPQTEVVGVVWLGWNTQDPEVMERADRGVSIRLLGVDGPGRVSVYLQSGNLAGPEVLWAGEQDPASVFVEVNTHTHANWAFAAPGAYLLRLEVSADLRDGTTVVETVDLRVAVSDEVAAEAVRGATFDAPVARGVAPGGGQATEDARGTQAAEVAAIDGAVSPALLAVTGAAVVLAGAVGVALWRGRSARRAARTITGTGR